MSAPALQGAGSQEADPPSSPDPLAAAQVAGLAGARQARVTPVGSSHAVTRVDAVGGSVVVKTLKPGLAEHRGLAAEAFAYRLAGWNDDLAGVLPAALLVDERRAVLVLEAGPPETVGGALVASGALPSTAACVALGRALATVHRATAGTPLPHPTNAGVLDLPGSSPEQLHLTTARTLALHLAEDPVLAACLQRGRAAWRAGCLVHGDVKWDNCLVALEEDPPRVRLIDWELSGWGDPAWDLGTFLAQASALELARGRPAEPDQRALVRAYAAAAEADPSPLSRLVDYWPARLVHLALECAEAGGDQFARALVDRARVLAAAREDTDRLVGSWLA